MLVIDRSGMCPWDPSLQPIDFGGHHPEEFEPWWQRNRIKLPHIHPQIAEQWIHKHWKVSPYRFIPLETLEWTLEKWPAREIVTSVWNDAWREYDPVDDYQAFTAPFTAKPHPTAAALDRGEWDYPILVLSTPNGVTFHDGPRVDVRRLLIEGHQRVRYLNALLHRGKAMGEQSVFLLRSPLAL